MRRGVTTDGRVTSRGMVHGRSNVAAIVILALAATVWAVIALMGGPGNSDVLRGRSETRQSAEGPPPVLEIEDTDSTESPAGERPAHPTIDAVEGFAGPESTDHTRRPVGASVVPRVRPFEVTGTVIEGQSGRPVTHGWVRAVDDPWAAKPRSLGAAPIGPDGSFSIAAELPPDVSLDRQMGLSVFVASDGHSIADNGSLHVTPAAPEPLELTVYRWPGGAVAGVTVDPAGRPVPHAHVWAIGSNEDSGLRSDSAGRFLLPMPEDRPTIVVAEHPSYGQGVARTEAGADDFSLQVVLEPVGVIEGRVVTRTGAPVAGLTVEAAPMDAPEGWPEPSAVATDAEGAFRFALLPDRPHLVWLQSRGPERGLRDVMPGATGLQLTSGHSALTVHIIHPAGALPGVPEVDVLPPHSGPTRLSLGLQRAIDGTALENGRAVIRGVLYGDGGGMLRVKAEIDGVTWGAYRVLGGSGDVVVDVTLEREDD